MLGLSRSAIMRLVELGFVKPKRGPRRSYLFSFQDVVLLRTAHELREATIPSSKIVRALRRLRDELPAEVPLTGLRITAVGNDIAVRNRDSQWAADSGQLLMDFDVSVEPAGGAVTVVRHLEAARRPASDGSARGSREAPATKLTPEALFARGEALEDVDVDGAIAAYSQALAVAPDYTNAYLNLGALLCETGECDKAVRLYAKAIEHRPKEPLLYFNRGVALEDLNRFAEALASYDKALQLDPELADAHYNAGLLNEALGNGQGAIRHYSAYRRLQR
jgi:tetratricopeptide (TPR) repeat protein